MMIKSYGFWYLEVDDRYYKELYKGDKEKRREYFRNAKTLYSFKRKKWISRKEYISNGDESLYLPSPFPCHSLKAAKRHLRKHDEIPKGTRFVLVSRYVGCDIHLIKK